MGDIINLRRARKSAAREQAGTDAAANRLRHGRSKAERALEAAREEKAQRELDQHRTETGEGR